MLSRPVSEVPTQFLLGAAGNFSHARSRFFDSIYIHGDAAMEIILGKRISLSVPHCDDMDAGNNRLYPLEKLQDGSDGPNLSEASDRALCRREVLLTQQIPSVRHIIKLLWLIS